MSGAPFATIPAANSNTRKRKAEHDHRHIFSGCDANQAHPHQDPAAVEGGSSSMPAGAHAEALACVAGGMRSADANSAQKLFPDEIQLWKAACFFARDPSLEELMTILKVRYLNGNVDTA